MVFSVNARHVVQASVFDSKHKYLVLSFETSTAGVGDTGRIVWFAVAQEEKDFLFFTGGSGDSRSRFRGFKEELHKKG